MTVQHFNGFTPLPPYPTPDMPDDAYNAAAYATTEAYPVMIAEMTAAAAVVENNANFSEQQAEASGASATAAAKSLIDVQTAANGAFAAASYKGEWSTLTGALNVPATVTHLGRLWYLKLNLASVTTQAPTLGSAYWGEVSRNDFTVLPCPAGRTVAADRGLYRMNSPSSILQLHPNPFHGMVAAAVNVSGSLTPVIERNGKTICGDAEDYLMNVLGWQIVLQYDSVSGDWVRVSGVTAFTPEQPPITSANTWTALQNFTAGLNINGNAVVSGGGSDSNGYVRFGDGTQICWVVSGNVTIAEAAGSIFVNGAAVGPFTWAAPFLTPPREFVTGTKFATPAGHCWAASVSKASTTQSGAAQLFRASASSDLYYVQFLAVGKWF